MSPERRLELVQTVSENSSTAAWMDGRRKEGRKSRWEAKRKGGREGQGEGGKRGREEESEYGEGVSVGKRG